MNKMIVLVMFAAACGKASGSNGGAPVVNERSMMDLQKQVMGAKFDDAVKVTEGILGPARAKDATDWEYAAIEGDTCFHFGLMKSGDTVGGVQNGSFKKGEMMYDDCAKLAVAKPAP